MVLEVADSGEHQ